MIIALVKTWTFALGFVLVRTHTCALMLKKIFTRTGLLGLQVAILHSQEFPQYKVPPYGQSCLNSTLKPPGILPSITRHCKQH